MRMKWRGAAVALVLALALALVVGGAFSPRAVAAGSYQLTLLETTDVHGNIYPWDYYKNAPVDGRGLAQVYTLVKQIRQENPNVMLFDNGDELQGTPLDYYYAKVEPIQPGQVHPMIQVMNYMGYQAASIGNHEFNYGLSFLDEVINDANYKYLSANVYKYGTTDPYFTPYVILDEALNGGQEHIKVGVLGLTTPGIVIWDKSNLDGKLSAGDMVAAAKKYVPEMKAKGADIIVVLAHAGTSGNTSYDQSVQPAPENPVLDLANQVPGINVIFAGHEHQQIPGKALQNNKVNGVTIVEASSWGQALGEVDLTLQKTDSGWQVTDAASKLLFTKGVQADQGVLDLVKTAHDKTVQYVTTPIGKTLTPISTAAARLADTAAMQLVNQVQMERVKEALQGTEYANLPVLSAAAPFNGDVNIKAGPVSIADIAGIYIYDNTLKAVLITGKDLRGWLEHSAENFLQVTTPDAGYTPIINPKFPGYNFDQIDGVRYQIDITKPVGQRIVNLTYNGAPVTDDQKFILATNNYRAGGGGNFPGTGKNAIVVYDKLEESRQLIIDYVKSHGTIEVEADNNWSLLPTFLNHWSAQYAVDLLNRGILIGGSSASDVHATGGSTDMGVLRLNDPVTRAELVKMLVTALDLPAASSQSPFVDVAGSWAQPYVDAAYAAGLVKGVDATHFDPDATVTRQDAALMVVRATAGTVPDNQNLTYLDKFSDRAAVSTYAEGAVAFALENGVLTGDAAGTLRPKATLTRGEAAKIIDLAVPEKVGPNDSKITLVTVNDFHGNLDFVAKYPDYGAAKLTTAFREERLANPTGTVLLSAGDMFQGTTVSNLVQGRSVIDWMNLAGFQAMAIGNHEFDWTVDVMKKDMQYADFPFLAANIYDEATGKPVTWAKPYVMLKAGGLNIGVIGIATPETKIVVMPKNVEGLDFRDPAPIVADLAGKLRAQGADLVVVLSHLASDQDKTTGVITGEAADMIHTLTAEYGKAPIDALITGHSHKYVSGYVDGVPVVQALSYGSAYGKITLVYNKDLKQVVRSNVQVVKPSVNLADNEPAADLVSRWHMVIGPLVNEQVATLAQDITRTQNKAGESALGDLIADSQRAATGADIAMMNSGGIRTDLPAGPVTWGQLYAVQPFGNILYTLKMTGQQIHDVLEQGVGGKGALQVSGISYKWDPNKPAGDRIDPKDILLPDGRPIDLNATYTVAANNFIATGGDNFTVFKSATSTYTGIVDLDAFVNYLKGLPQPVQYQLQNRISVVGQ